VALCPGVPARCGNLPSTGIWVVAGAGAGPSKVMLMEGAGDIAAAGGGGG
jgi:hypothetical protein